MKNYLTGSVTSQVLYENFMVISCSVSLTITRIATDDNLVSYCFHFHEK